MCARRLMLAAAIVGIGLAFSGVAVGVANAAVGVGTYLGGS
ncbi:hypothetical protein [Sphingomonas jinjuensis]|nr:hypothetical protein [Sphingomonas jinjuensis]